MKYYFKNKRDDQEHFDTLIFAKKACIIEFNWETDEVITRCNF
jgi:hypothetical protein